MIQGVGGLESSETKGSMGMYFVYILVSLNSGRSYVGQTDNLIRRFHQHREGLVRSTREKLMEPGCYIGRNTTPAAKPCDENDTTSLVPATEQSMNSSHE